MDPKAEDMLLDDRRARVDAVVARRTRNLCVVLEAVEDPHNLAAVLRTSEALGIQEVHFVESATARFRPNPKITQGAEKWLDIEPYASVKECVSRLRTRGYRVLATRPGPPAISLFDLTFEGKVALLFGNEVDGVSAEAVAVSDGTFWVPMRGMVPSLNISVAAAVSLAHAVYVRQRRLGDRGDLTRSEAEALSERFYKLAVKQRGRIFGDDP